MTLAALCAFGANIIKPSEDVFKFGNSTLDQPVQAITEKWKTLVVQLAKEQICWQENYNMHQSRFQLHVLY